MSRLTRGLGLALIVAAAGGATAVAEGGGHKHEEHHHGGSGHDVEPHHGGVLEEIGERHAELVIGGGKLSVFLADHDGNHLEATGFKAEALVLAGSERQGPYALTPAEDDSLQGDAPAPAKGSRVVVTLTDPAGKAAQARFEIK